MNIYFLTTNKYKMEEAATILNSDQFKLIQIDHKIHEIQSFDMNEVVEDKVLKAFQEIGRPVIVEQTGLLLKDLNWLPGGLTQAFWDALQTENFCKFFSENGTGTGIAIAKTVVAFCDGQQIHTFEGSIKGVILDQPRGCNDFQWDCIFLPDGHEETLAELAEEKSELSMRRIALEKLKNYLEKRYD